MQRFQTFDMLLILLTYLVSHLSNVQATDRPVIGVLTQDLSPSMFPTLPGIEDYSSWIVASNVKWLEAGGVQVVPIIVNGSIDQTDYFREMFSSLNGLMIPGGPDVSMLPDAGYSKASYAFFTMAMEANDAGDFFPIWGTCLGMEMLGLITTGGQEYLTRCTSYGSLPLELSEGWEDSQLYGSAPSDVIDQFTSLPVTVNRHHWCLTQENFTNFGMDAFWTVLSENSDPDGIRFISTLEAKDYPFFAIQYHPEKSSYTWTDQPGQQILHSKEATHTALYLSQFLASLARQSAHKFSSRAAEEAAVVYNYDVFFTGREEVGSSNTQVYLF